MDVLDGTGQRLLPTFAPGTRYRGFRPRRVQMPADATPLARIDLPGAVVHAKLERERPSGSFKDVAAEFLVGRMRGDGAIRRRGRPARMVVSSSGNFATAIAHHTVEDRVHLTVVTDVLSPRAIRERLARYSHVRTITVDRPDPTNSHMAARREEIARLHRDDPNLVEIDQYDNRVLPEGYACRLVPELFAEMGWRVGVVFAAIGTGGLVNGLCRFRRRLGLPFRVVAVDAQGSCLARKPRHGAVRQISGFGNGRSTGLFREVVDEIDLYEFVTDEDTVAMCHAQAARGRLLGGSGGAVLAAIAQVAAYRPWLLEEHGPVAAILADGGESYADTIYNPDWLREKGLLSAVRRPVAPPVP